MQIWCLYFSTFDLISIPAVERFKIRTEKDSFLVSIFGWTKKGVFLVHLIEHIPLQDIDNSSILSEAQK